MHFGLCGVYISESHAEFMYINLQLLAIVPCMHAHLMPYVPQTKLSRIAADL